MTTNHEPNMTMDAVRYGALLLVAALLVSCNSGPEPGDMYEHVRTAERIEIDTIRGCGDLARHYERHNEMMRKVADSESQRLRLLVTPYLHADSTGRCFVHKTKEDVPAGAGKEWELDGERHDTLSMTVAHLRSLRALDEKYEKVK